MKLTKAQRRALEVLAAHEEVPSGRSTYGAAGDPKFAGFRVNTQAAESLRSLGLAQQGTPTYIYPYRYSITPAGKKLLEHPDPAVLEDGETTRGLE